MNTKKIAVAAVLLAGALGSGLAEARDRDDVHWSVTIGNPAPVYGHGVQVIRPVVPARPYYQAPTRWDRDGDGIPNRYDRVHNPRWDRDGDGIPNRYDHRPYRPDGARDGYGHRGYGR
jgi:hypothetical protein